MRKREARKEAIKAAEPPWKQGLVYPTLEFFTGGQATDWWFGGNLMPFKRGTFFNDFAEVDAMIEAFSELCPKDNYY